MAEVRIVVVEGPNEGREFELSGATTVGRDPSAGIVIDDAEASRRHASLSVEGDDVSVEDLGSTNGTFVNGRRLSEAQTLGSGDKLRIGTTVFEVHMPAPAAGATRVGTALPDLDDLQVTAPRQVPDFAQDEPAEAPAPEPVAEAPAPATEAPPPSAGPPGGAAAPPAGAPDIAPPPPGGAAPPPSAPPPAFPPPTGGPGAPPPGPPGPPPGPPGPPPGAPAPPPGGPGYAPPPAPIGAPPPGQPVPFGAGALATGAYPATFEADYPESGIARWRALFQGYLAIPHFFALVFVGIGAYIAWFIAAWAIVFTRRYPPGLFNFIAGTLKWSNRVNGFTRLMTEQYPPFSLDDEPSYPIRTQIAYPEQGIARWRPFFQIYMALPHIVVLWFLAAAQAIAFFIAALAILFTRSYPPGLFNFIVGVTRWQTRVAVYVLLMTEQYPPFELT